MGQILKRRPPASEMPWLKGLQTAETPRPEISATDEDELASVILRLSRIHHIQELFERGSKLDVEAHRNTSSVKQGRRTPENNRDEASKEEKRLALRSFEEDQG